MTQRAKRLLLCATGGFHCTTLPGFVLSLVKHFADDVQVVLSRAAAKLTSPYAVEVASRHHVFTEMDETADGIFVPHIELGLNVDLVLVYPATVNILGKVANGIADELIAAIILATKAPVFFVPVTNGEMWSHPAVQRNVKQLEGDGYTIVPPPMAVEVATREGLESSPDVFPHPTLLARMRAKVAG
jgi:phosphopantothenoylcysteine decarboxylase/phosphopantothenate--cysteine ligase